MAPGNGAFVGKVEKDGWTTWNWRARSIHPYGSVLDVGPYKVTEADYKSRFRNTIPMRFYYLPGEEKAAAVTLPMTNGMAETPAGARH